MTSTMLMAERRRLMRLMATTSSESLLEYCNDNLDRINDALERVKARHRKNGGSQ